MGKLTPTSLKEAESDLKARSRSQFDALSHFAAFWAMALIVFVGRLRHMATFLAEEADSRSLQGHNHWLELVFGSAIRTANDLHGRNLLVLCGVVVANRAKAKPRLGTLLSSWGGLA